MRTTQDKGPAAAYLEKFEEKWTELVMQMYSEVVCAKNTSLVRWAIRTMTRAEQIALGCAIARQMAINEGTRLRVADVWEDEISDPAIREAARILYGRTDIAPELTLHRFPFFYCEDNHENV